VLADLDPDLAAAIAAVPEWAGLEPRQVAPLPAGITNRNFRVDIAGESFVLRLAGEDTDLLGIDREQERAAADTCARAGVAPEVFGFLPEHGCLITRFVQGEPIPTTDLEREEILARVVDSVRAIHESPEIPGAFSAFRVVQDYRDVAASRGVGQPELYSELAERSHAIESAFEGSPDPVAACHNDLLNANLLLDENHVWIVDYEYAGMGERFFDLGNLSINNGLSESGQAMLLRLYFGDPSRRHAARLKLMRVMSDFREGMWGLVQQGISRLDFDYVGYTTKHLERCRAGMADERFDSWLRDAAQPH
jgi:thiamine kinase-like enzyme